MVPNEHAITVDPANQIVIVLAKGFFSVEEGCKIVTTARTLAHKHKFNILYDARLVEMKLKLTDWFYLPRTLPVFKDAEARKIKVGILASETNKDMEFEFIENVSNNLGFNLKLFYDRDQALQWLTPEIAESNLDTKNKQDKPEN
ncbi:MAG: hypothetical protein AAF502_06925 [Bacteroidota bacterium]